MLQHLSQCNARESAFFLMFGRDLIYKLNSMLHEVRRYFHYENGLPDLEALKNIYQVVAQQLLNSREVLEETSQPKASRVLTESRRPCPDGKPHSQSI